MFLINGHILLNLPDELPKMGSTAKVVSKANYSVMVPVHVQNHQLRIPQGTFNYYRALTQKFCQRFSCKVLQQFTLVGKKIHWSKPWNMSVSILNCVFVRKYSFDFLTMSLSLPFERFLQSSASAHSVSNVPFALVTQGPRHGHS